MSDFLADYRRKRARAEVHLRAIERAVKQFTQREPSLVPGKFDPERGQYVFEWPRPLPEPGLSLLIGDCVYNLRASLDYLMTALVRSMGNEETNQTAFPIYDVPIGTVPFTAVRTRWETDPNGDIAGKLRGAPPETKSLIQKLQPFDGVPGEDPDDHPLAILKALSNRDKHRRLNVVASQIGITFTDAHGEPVFNQPLPHAWVAIPEDTESDRQIVTLKLSNGVQKPKVPLHLRSSYDVTFDENGPPFKESVIQTLTHIGRFIDSRVVPTIQVLLGSRRSPTRSGAG